MMQIQVSDPVNSQAGVLPPSSVKNEDPSYKEVFMKAIRGQNLTHEEASVMQEYKAALSENTGKDGGFIVPEDITTTINQLKQTTDSLEQYVNVQPVSTNKGARTLEKRAKHLHLLRHYRSMVNRMQCKKWLLLNSIVCLMQLRIMQVFTSAK